MIFFVTGKLIIRGWFYFGAGSPQIHLLPQIQKLADRSDVISEVHKCSKVQLCLGCAPVPAGTAYSTPPVP